MAEGAVSATDKSSLSHNLLGQRLGRKGRGTRERILAAVDRLLASPHEVPITLSAVAREASLGMTTLYLYFSDLTELLLAALEPIMACAEEVYVARLRTRWPDDALSTHCLEFIQAYHGFWERHVRMLHFRDSFADGKDARMLTYRVAMSHKLIELLVWQMDGDTVDTAPVEVSSLASVLLISVERLLTVTTDANFSALSRPDPLTHARSLVRAEARLLELGIRDGRSMAGRLGKGRKEGLLF